jgi:DNA (cytosine-5)-methyltransferase 1
LIIVEYTSLKPIPEKIILNILSLFSGAGGLDLGFEEHGFTPVLAYDNKPSAVNTYNFNRTRKVARVADLGLPRIADQIIHDVESLGEHDIPKGVVGGPPCQYFSNGNKAPRKDEDIRRLLPRRYANILHKLNEKYQIDFFILENVEGLTQPKHADDFNTILEMFEGAGFHTTWKILDAFNFGVPQYRKRVFIIGWNKQLYPQGVFIFPEGKPCGLTVKSAISGLDSPTYFHIGLDPTKFPIHPNHWTMVPKSKKFNAPAPLDLKKSVRSFRRVDWDKPSYTVAYGHNEIHIHPEGNRRLSIYEAMLLQGFPGGKEGYRLIGGLSEQVSLVSDAVPPPLASALASAIKKFITNHRFKDDQYN